MDSVFGFLLINGYAFLLIISTTILFFAKPRLKKIENRLYKNFLLANVFMSLSGLILGVLVTPDYYVNDILIILFNKIYLVCLFYWIFLLTFYILYISIKNQNTVNKCKNLFTVIMIISLLFILFAPVTVAIKETGATSSGLAIMYTYAIFALGFLTQIICVLVNYKNIKNKKYTPVYVLIVLGTLMLIIQVIDPNTNYLINPVLIFVAVIMFHTIENPDLRLLNEYVRNKELVETNSEDKSNMLFKISQDVKVPANEIEKISNEIITSDNIDEIHKNVVKINSLSRDVTNTINNILDISDFDIRNVKMVNVSYKAYNLFNQILLLSKEKIKDGIEFKYSISSLIPENLYGDSLKLKQVIYSILVNAINNTEKGFIDLDVSSIIKYDICRLIITISDTGKGMSLDEINQILASDNNLDEAELEKVNDLDVDIKIAKKIIAMLGGTLFVKSEENVGTTFTIIVNQKIEVISDKKASRTLKKLSYSLSNKKKVLLVDDDYRELQLISEILKQNNYEVISTMYGKDCIDRLNSDNDFDLLLIDDEMEPKNAVEVIKEIKNDKLKMIVMLNADKEEIKHHYLKDYPFADYLLKRNYKEEVKRIAEKY